MRPSVTFSNQFKVKRKKSALFTRSFKRGDLGNDSTTDDEGFPSMLEAVSEYALTDCI